MLFFMLLACKKDADKIDDGAIDSAFTGYSMEITEPQYGAFYQENVIPIEGKITPVGATLLVEGIPIATNNDGEFSFTLPFDADYEIVDFELLEGELSERIPVYRGEDPISTWPGGLTARLLPLGMDVLGRQLGAALDETGWSEQISTQLPSTDWGTGGLYPVGLVHDPTVVALSPQEEGVAVDFTLNRVGLEYELQYDLFGVMMTDTLSFIIDEVAIGATAVPYLDDNGVLIFSLVEADLTMSSPDLVLGQLDPTLLEWLLQAGWDWILEPLSEMLLDTILAEIGSLEIGGPFAFETEFMGAPFGIELYDIYGDIDGLALGVEMEIGDMNTMEEVDIPVPTEEDAPEAQLAVALHEGLFHQLLSGQLLDLLSQDLDLAGSFGAIIGNGIMALPGGDDAPSGDGWCLDINPGDTNLVRMHESVTPLASLYLPDFRMNVGIQDDGDCEDWLNASLATEVQINVKEGSKLAIDVKIDDGSLLYYGSDDYQDGDISEEEVIEALGNYMSTMLGLLGGVTEVDLGEFLSGGVGETGTGFGDLSISIHDSSQMYNEEGDKLSGLYALSIDLWNTSVDEEDDEEGEVSE